MSQADLVRLTALLFMSRADLVRLTALFLCPELTLRLTSFLFMSRGDLVQLTALMSLAATVRLTGTLYSKSKKLTTFSLQQETLDRLL